MAAKGATAVNPFDQFDAAPAATAPAPKTAAPPAAPTNPFDQFDPPKPVAAEKPAPDRGKQLQGGLLKGIPAMLQSTMEAQERGRQMGVGLPGADLVAGMLEPAVDSLLHRKPIETPYSDAAAKEIGTVASAAHVNPWDYFPDPEEDDPLGRIIQAGGEGVAGALIPNGEMGLVQKGLDVLANVAGGAGGQAAAEVVPEEYKPAAGLVGGLAGGFAGATVPELAVRGAKKAIDFVQPAVPGQKTNVAAKMAASQFDDPQAALDALNQKPHDIVPGSRPDTATVTGDRGIKAATMSAARTDPNFRGKLLAQQDERNQALIGAMEGMRDPGNAGAAADFFRTRMADLEAKADALYDQHRQRAEGAASGLGEPVAGEVGAQGRQAISTNLKALSKQADTLWKSIDPDGTMHVATDPLVGATAKIYGAMSPEEKLSLSPSEKLIAGIIGSYDQTIPFSRFSALRSEISRAMREAKSFANPNDRAYGRLSQLRSAIEDAVSDSIAGRVAKEQNAVATGALSEDDTLTRNFLRQAQDWYANRDEASGRRAYPGNGVPEAPRPAPVSGGAGAAGEAGRGPASDAGAQGLPEDAGRAETGVGADVAGRFQGAGRPEPEAKATGAIANAVYSTLARFAGLTPEEFAAKYPLPGVQKSDVAPEGSLHQSQYNSEFHPATAFMDMADAHPERMSPRYNDINTIIKDAWEAGGRRPNDIVRMIDINGSLNTRAKQAVRDAMPSITDDQFRENGGVGNTFMDVVKAYAPKEEEWNKEFGVKPTENLPAVPHQAATAPTFYSQAKAGVEAVKAEKMPADQWISVIKKLPAVRQEELDWLGIEPWLKEQKGSITKQDVANYIRDNSLQVEDVTLRNDTTKFQRKYFDRQEFDGDDGEEFDPQIRQGEFEPEEPDDDYMHERADEMVQEDAFREEHLDDAREKAIDDWESEQRADEFEPDHEELLKKLRAVYDGTEELNAEPDMHPDIFGGETPITPPPNPVNERLMALKDEIDKRAEGHLHDKAVEQAESDHYNGDPDGTRSVRVRWPGDHPDEHYTYYTYGGGDGGWITGEGINDTLEFGYRDDPDDVLMNHLRERWDEMEHGDPDARDAHEAEQDRLEAEHTEEQDRLEEQHNEEQRNAPRDNVKVSGSPRFGSYAAPGGTKYTELLLKLPDTRGDADTYRAGHWEAPNVLAHVRFDTRDVGGKRTLFLQEVQSDWHQQGQKQGYQGPDSDAKYQAAKQAVEDARKARDDMISQVVRERSGGRFDNYEDYKENLRVEYQAAREKHRTAMDNHDLLKHANNKDGANPDPEAIKKLDDAEAEAANNLKAARQRYEDADTLHRKLLYESAEVTAINRAEQELHAVAPHKLVPNAPFKDAGWRELVLKRMLRWAAEHGYDQLAWTPGDLKNGSLITRKPRFVEYRHGPEGQIGAHWADEHGNNIGTSHVDGTIDDMRKQFGSKIADQIAADEGNPGRGGHKRLDTPEGVRVGGDLQEFYGRSLPSLMKKILKKFGADVGSAPMKLLGDDINAVTVPITEKMRDIALHVGMPLFQKGERGAINFGDNFQSMISLLKHADESTGVHELSHQFLRMYKDLAERDGAAPRIRDDWGIVKNWWKTNAVHVAADAGHDVTPAQVHKVLRDGTTGDADLDAHIDRGFHEQWARGFEQYLKNGEAPTQGLAGVFKKFKDWMGNIYRSLTGLNIDLSPEMKGVFDRMLGGAEPRTTPAPKMLDAAAAGRFKAATAATRNLKEISKPSPVREIMRRQGSTMPFDLSDEGVSAKLFRPGAEGAAAIKNVMRAAGDSADARSAIEASAILSMRRAALKDGVIDPVKLDAWRAKHTDALREVPGLDRRLTSAADATKAMIEIGAKRKAAIDAVQKSAAGKLLRLHSDADVATTLGSMLGRGDAVKSMRALVADAKGDPVALAGLRRGVIDHMVNQFRTPKDALRSDSFQKYLGKNAAALGEVLSPEQMNGLRAVAQELKRSSKDHRAPGGGSDTRQNFADSAHYNTERTWMGRLIDLIMDSGLGVAITALTTPFHGLGATAVSFVLQEARAAGIRRAGDLLKEAYLDPELMRSLLMKAPKGKNKGSAVAVARSLSRLALAGAMGASAAQR